MHKIIHSKFELDLTPYGVSTVEDNHWFSDGFFTKYSFPFTLKLEEDLLLVFGDLLDDNNILNETYFEVQYVIGNKLEAAIFEITEQNGLELEVSFRWGIEEFPNWDKKLSDLPLYKSKLYTYTIDQYAELVINYGYPQFPFNFPQIHTDAYNGVLWEHFEGTINNYDGSIFIKNTVVSNVIYNKNIMQPLPYLLHVLKAGVEDAGYTLKGDILENEKLQKVLLYHHADYYDLNIWTNNFICEEDDLTYLGSNNPPVYRGFKEINIVQNRAHKVTGSFRIKESVDPGGYFDSVGEFKIWGVFYSGGIAQKTLLYNSLSEDLFTDEDGYIEANIDVAFQKNNPFKYIQLDAFTDLVPEAFNIDITEVFEEESTEAYFKDEIDLKKTVANVTFGYLISELKKLCFIDVSVVDKDIYVNIIENMINNTTVVDLSHKEVVPKKTPPIKKQFSLKYKDVDNDNFKHQPIYINEEGVSFDQKTDIDTDTTEIEIIPLPQFYRTGVKTAYAIENNADNLYFVVYEGYDDETFNSTKTPVSFSLENIYYQFYISFFTFFLKSILYKWKFIDWIENISEISKKIFAYGKYHIVKTLNKTQISKDLYEVEIETESLE